VSIEHGNANSGIDVLGFWAWMVMAVVESCS
jgi:hypothetical protein